MSYAFINSDTMDGKSNYFEHFLQRVSKSPVTAL